MTIHPLAGKPAPKDFLVDIDKLRKECYARKPDMAFGHVTDNDHLGIVTYSSERTNPNHYVASAIFHLFTHRPGWRPDAAIGKTVVSNRVIDRVAVKVGRLWSKCRWDSNGLCPADWTDRWLLAAKGAQGLNFYDARTQYGQPTKMVLS